MEKKTLSELENYLSQIEPELKAIQDKLGINITDNVEELENINLDDLDIDRLAEIFETINDKFGDIEIDDDIEKENN